MEVIGALLDLDNDDVKTLGAAATTFGVLIALFGPAWRRWWRSPLLTLAYQNKQGEPYWDHVLLGGTSFFLRLRVSNAPGCDSAENVQVIVSAFRSDVLGLDERPLEWSGQHRTKKRAVTSIDIPPGLSRHVDLLQVKPTPDLPAPATAMPSGDSGPAATTAKTVAHLCVYPPPWGGAHIVHPGDPDIKVILTASNANAVRYSMTLRFNDELCAYLIVPPERETMRPLERLRRSLRRRHSRT